MGLNKSEINPATGKMYAVNPATNQWDDNWFSNVFEPQWKAQQPVTAESIIAPVQDKLKEQITFLKDFLDKNPLAFDEALARQMAEQKFKPYYEQVLNDFVNPLQERISRSFADESKLLTELVRRKDTGSKEIKDVTEQAINRSKEGFAGANLLGSGIESGFTARQNLTGTNKLNDFIAGNTYQQEGVKTEAERARTDAQTLIAQKKRDIFDPGREYEANMAQDVEAQRGVELKKTGIKTLDAIASRFGSPLPEIPRYLELYNT